MTGAAIGTTSDDDQYFGDAKSLQSLAFYLKSLDSRQSRHSQEMQAGFEKVFTKLDRLSEKQTTDKAELIKMITDVEKSAVKESSAIKMKLAMFVGCLGIGAGGVGSAAWPVLKEVVKGLVK